MSVTEVPHPDAPAKGSENADATPVRRRRARISVGFALVLLAAVVSLVVGLLVGPAHISFADVAGALGRRLGGAGTASCRGAIASSSTCACRACWSASSPAARWRWRAPRCRGCFATRWPSPACSASRRARRWAPCWRSTSSSRGARCGRCPPAAFLGAAVVAVLVFAIAARQGRGRVFTSTLLLVGVALMALNVSLTTFVLSVSLASYDVGREVMYWLLGGLEGRTWDHLLLGVPAIAVGAAHHRGARARPGRPAAGRGRRAVGGRRRAARTHPAGAGQRAGGRRGGRGGGADRVRRPAGPAPVAAGDRARARYAGADLVRGRRRVPGDRGRGGALARAEMPVGVITAAVGAPVFLALLMRRRVEVAGP